MLKVQIRLEQIFLRLKINKSNENPQQKLYLQFHCLFDNNQTTLKQKARFTQHFQHLQNISHIIYVKKSQFNVKNLKFKVILKNFDEKLSQSQNKIHKYVGDCELKLEDLDLFGNELPIGFQTKLQLKRCSDKQAYLRLKIIVRQIDEFKNAFKDKEKSQSKDEAKEDNIDDIQNTTLQQTHFKQQTNLLLTTQQQTSQLKSRNTRLQQQITRLQTQNQQLQAQLKQTQQTIKINQQLQQDKLDLLIQRNIKTEEQYKRVKENIGKVFNLANQYGRMDVIEKIGQLLSE